MKIRMRVSTEGWPATDGATGRLVGDADLASDPEDRVSTTGVYFELRGPNTRMPLMSLSKKQTSVSHSTREAEIVAAAHALRAIGLPALSLWAPFRACQGSWHQAGHGSRGCHLRLLLRLPTAQQGWRRYSWPPPLLLSCGLLHKARSWRKVATRATLSIMHTM